MSLWPQSGPTPLQRLSKSKGFKIASIGRAKLCKPRELRSALRVLSRSPLEGVSAVVAEGPARLQGRLPGEVNLARRWDSATRRRVAARLAGLPLGLTK